VKIAPPLDSNAWLLLKRDPMIRQSESWIRMLPAESAWLSEKLDELIVSSCLYYAKYF
jgi:hypothetical protein